MKHNQNALSFFFMATMFSFVVGCSDKIAVSEDRAFSLAESSTSLELADLNNSQQKVITCEQLCGKVAQENKSPVLFQALLSPTEYRCDIRSAKVFFSVPSECIVPPNPTCDKLCAQVAKDNNSPILLQELTSPTEYRCDIRSAKVYFSVPDECVAPPKPSCSQLCDQMAKDNNRPVLLKGLVSSTEYRCDIRGAQIYYSVPTECTATYQPECELGMCKGVGAPVTHIVPSSESKVRVLSGKALEIYGSNRADLNVIVHKGASAIYFDSPMTNKRAYFEGSAKDYSFTLEGTSVLVKDSCGVISRINVGRDLKVKMIFQDGTQEIVLVSGSARTFKFVLNGAERTLVSLSAGEYMPAGYNYMNSTETSKPHFAQACGL